MSATGIILGISLTMNIVGMNLAWIVPLIRKWRQLTRSWIVGISPATGLIDLRLHKVTGNTHVYTAGGKQGLLAWEPDMLRRTSAGQPVMFADMDTMHGIGMDGGKRSKVPVAGMAAMRPYSGVAANDDELSEVKQKDGSLKTISEPVWRRFPGTRILQVLRGGWMKELNDNTSPLVAIAQALAVPALIIASLLMVVVVVFMAGS